MIEIVIPNYHRLQLEHLILDYNGTIAYDGKLIAGVAPRLHDLAARLRIHVLTADTFGNVKSQLSALPCELAIIPAGAQDVAKLAYIKRLVSTSCVCIGNGRNDSLMLQEAALGIAVMQREGVAGAAMMAADVIAPDIIAALELLTNPLRLTATLRV